MLRGVATSMGYDMAFLPKRDWPPVDEWAESDELWASSGWSMRPLYQAFRSLGTPIDDLSCAIPTDSLSFVGRLRDRIHGQAFAQVLCAIARVDPDVAFDFLDSLDAAGRAAVCLCFALDDVSEDEAAVCHELCSLFMDGFFDVVDHVASVWDKATSGGLSEVCLCESY